MGYSSHAISLGHASPASWFNHAQPPETPQQLLDAYVKDDKVTDLRALLDHKSNVDAIVEDMKDRSYSPVHSAAKHGSLEVLSVLLAKLPVAVWHMRCNADGCTPFMLVAENGKQEFVAQFVMHLSDVVTACKDSQGEPARAQAKKDLMAAFGCAEETPDAEMLNSVTNALMNAQDDWKNTAAHLAFKSGHFDYCWALCFWGANPDIENKQHETLRSLARELPHDSELYVLLHGKTEQPNEVETYASKGSCTIS
ncbi:ankyrin repeat domain-containing protein [Bordetella sp. 15P40C-2]|uniref:ankyrin repeat domain-containing protein n=1 Tax=Bordetella sp. 15P40C-2 TaxID=2572246 RepID=UPI00132C54EC|nr:ankyrin repeat domain-containing protein [Bordetella sp. 15P40C-2]MVW70061.1 hypothetical protein [Bordetella sp. 15P40C-2]